MNQARRKALAAIDFQAIRDAADNLAALMASAKDTIDEVRQDEEEAREALPESIQESERGEKMQTIIDALDELSTAMETDLSEITSAIDEFEGVEL